MMAGMRAKLTVGLALATGLALLVAANWQLLHLAVSSHPGCVDVDPARSAAKPGC